MNFHFHHLHTPYSMQGCSFSSLPPHSLYFEALKRQSFLTWQPANMFFLWKCDDILFISYVIRPNSTHYIFVIVGGVRICCRQVATILLTVWKIENSQPSCSFLIFFISFLTCTSQSCEHNRQQRACVLSTCGSQYSHCTKYTATKRLSSTFQRGGCGNVK